MRRLAIYSTLMLVALGLVALNYYLWVNQESTKQRIEGLQMQVGLHQAENQALNDRNEAILIEVENLRSPNAYVSYEEKAREDYGMIGQNETYFVLADDELAALPDVPGLIDEKPVVVNPGQVGIDSQRADVGQVDVIAVSPVPLRLESLQDS